MDDPSTTGSTEGFGLMFYNARWMDPVLGRFIQADTMVPLGVQGADRFAYVSNSPIDHTDPSGHAECNTQEDCADLGTTPYGAIKWKNRAPRPDKVCMADFACYEAYKTYNELIYILERFPTPEEILYITAQAEGYGAKGNEYHGSGTFEGNFTEGLARNYWEPYETCQQGSSWNCSANKLYKFMSGYQPWFDRSRSPTQRALYLVGKLEMDTFRADLEDAVVDITNLEYAREQGWTGGMWGDQPWQWHNCGRGPSSGEALGWVYSPSAYGNYFWVMTANQTDHFQDVIKPTCLP